MAQYWRNLRVEIENIMLSLNLINHLLKQNTEICQELAGYNGLVIGIRAGSLSIVGRMGSDGLLTPTHRQADTTLILHNEALPKILQGNAPDLSDLAVEGDMELGWGIMMRCARLRYTPQLDLRRLLGDEATERLAEKASKIGQTLQVIGQTLLFQAASLAPNKEQQKLLDQLHICTDTLTDVQKQLEKTNHQLADLERQMKMYDID